MVLLGTSEYVTDGTEVCQLLKMMSGTHSKKVAILQSNYIPWKGYFDIINSVDEFVIYDEVQYTKNDWRNRNIIKSKNGLIWLTIPVKVKGSFHQKIKDTEIANKDWNLKHWKTICMCYSRAPFFNEYKSLLEEIYFRKQSSYLSEINMSFIKLIAQLLGIRTKISSSSDYKLGIGKTEKLVQICNQAGATEYFSGPSAQGYINEALFKASNIKLTYVSYDDYKEYEQLFPPFKHNVSVIDLILNTGPQSIEFLKSYRNG
jgi:hypothetical protein